MDGSATKTATYTCVEVATVPSAQTDYMKKCIRAAYDAFDRDHPEVFWLTGNTSVLTSSSSDGNVTFNFALRGVLSETQEVCYGIRDTQTYSDAEAITNAIVSRNNAIDSIISNSSPSSGSDAEKVEYFDNWLTTHNEYNTSVSGENYTAAPKSAWECISALEGRTGASGPVCEGYSRAMKVLCDKANIPCVLVDGNASADSSASGAHMWNYVQIGDAWYGVDTTWNDPTGGNTSNARSDNENQNYLLVGSSTPNTHNKTFIESHPVANQASNGGVGFTNGPELSETALVKNISATAPTKITYNVSDVFKPDGMTLTATYWYTTTTNTQATSTISDDYETAGVTWEPKTFSNTSDTTVTNTYGGQTFQQAVTVNDVSSTLTIDSDINNGSITASVDGQVLTSVTNVESGKTVILTVAPNANYELVANSLKITHTTGSQDVTVSGSGTAEDPYTFTMPAYAVTVTAQFRQQTTAAPTFTSNEDALASVDDKEATFTLTSTPVDTYKIYNDATGETIVSAVTAIANGSTLTLTFTTAPTTDTTYYISATESGKAESSRTAVTVHPYSKSNDATLSNLTITGGALSPVFASGTTEYTVEVPYSVDSVTVTPTVTNSKASVTVNNQNVTSGNASNTISLTAGQEISITVEVTAESGTTQSYTITVTRAAAQYGITLSETGTHTFPSLGSGYGEYEYTDYSVPLTVTVTNTGDVDTGSLTVALSGVDANSFTLTNDSLSSIAVGNTTTFTVKPNTGLPQGTYTAAVTVSGSNGIGAAFDISFTVAASQNEANVKYAIATIKAAPLETWSVSQAACESLTIIDELDKILTELMDLYSLEFGFKRIAVEDITDATAGTASNPQGTNGTYNFTLTASGGAADDSDYYTEDVTITGCPIIATPYPVGDDVTLSDLILSEGTLTPAFSSGVYTYTATVPDTTRSITITPTTKNSKASVTVNGKMASQPVPLTIGDTKISVVITAEDGTTTQTYTITVTRLQPEYFTITFDANGGSVSPADATTTASGILSSLRHLSAAATALMAGTPCSLTAIGWTPPRCLTATARSMPTGPTSVVAVVATALPGAPTPTETLPRRPQRTPTAPPLPQ